MSAARTPAASAPRSPTPTTTPPNGSCWTRCAPWWSTPTPSNGARRSACRSPRRSNWNRPLPSEAFFAPVEHAPVEHVPAERAAGRICAEMISPYPPGVPVVAPAR
ncbi:hypothetical protein [Streptomyces bullii]|uniref:Orn/Lys/Arg decarboxylase C-terminal domain-containing protein n=1 Tax=Streptomyces bullii TaxID=349910 RepID=A0ABW0UYW9_9ACTN